MSTRKIAGFGLLSAPIIAAIAMMIQESGLWVTMAGLIAAAAIVGCFLTGLWLVDD